MSVDIGGVAKSAGQRGDQSGTATPRIDKDRLARLVSEFESSLMMQMIQEMRRAARWDDGKDEGSLGETQSLFEMLDAELATQLTRSDRLGLMSQLGGGSNASGPGAAGNGSAGASGITSGFGWRQDPLTGGVAFHRGIDLRAAYGQDVVAAVPGRIVTAGAEGGYGTAVVVEHADGTRARYAHLSAALVHEGDQVAQGQVIGRAGNSGRATGPHLHFEVLDSNGVPLDPLGTRTR